MNETPKTNVRKKQIKNKSKRKKNGSNILIYSFLTITMLSVIIVLSLTVFFKATEIKVEGAGERYSKEDIISAAGVSVGDNLFLIDGDNTEDKIEQQLPYIEKAEIIKKFPSTVKIKVEETVPDRIYNVNGRFALCKGEKVLEIIDDYVDGYTYYDIPINEVKPGEKIVTDSEISETYNELVKAIKDTGIENVTAVSFKNKVDIKLIYDNRLLLEIGTTENINDKLITALEVIERVRTKHGNNIEGSINLKYLVEGNTETYFTQEAISDLNILPGAKENNEK